MHSSAEVLCGTRTKLFIGGAWTAPHSGRTLDSYDPATGEPWYEAVDADADVTSMLALYGPALQAASFMAPAGGFQKQRKRKHNALECIRQLSRVTSVVVDYSGAARDPFVMHVKKG